MIDDIPPRISESSKLPPLVDWMSRHGWKLLAALFALELLFHAYAVAAQTSATSVGGGQASVRVNVSTTVPAVAFVRQVAPLSVVALADGRREVSFNVVVTANCQWRLSVRPRFPYRRANLPRIEVKDTDGAWKRLDQEEDGVVVVASHEPCTAEGHPVVLRLESVDAVNALGRVQFDVTPIPQ